MAVSVQQLVFAYQKDSVILDIPAWTLDRAEQVFLHGPSGTGKSTLLNLLSGILQPTSGSVEVLGQTLETLSGHRRDRWRARHVGVVFQQFNLIPHLNAVDNIQLAAHFGGATNANSRAIELLTSLGIEQRLHRQRADQLSIGQQQRVAIARAFVNRPELLLVDEPTSALDHQSRDDFMTLLLDQARQHSSALVFVSHDHSMAQHFSRVESLSDINQAGGKR